MFEQKKISKDEVVLIVTGSLSGETTSEFHRQVEELAAGGTAVITLDLSKTESINSSALGKILLFRKKLAEQERTLQIRGCSESLFKTFQMIKFDTLISIKK
ncbi:MAG: STAS domain-containing protein [Spirochaetia bacterium]|jgi:anti-anti-sigma factor